MNRIATRIIAIISTTAAAITGVASAQAAKAAKSCTTLAAAGSGPTKAIAEIMANGGLKNIATSRGYTPEGNVKLTCKDGTFLTECIAQSRICK